MTGSGPDQEARADDNRARRIGLADLGTHLRENAGARWLIEPDPGAMFAGATIDSRELLPGQLFFAFEGEHVDGHRFAGEALARAAAGAVVSRANAPDGSAWSGGPVLLVDSPERALVESARFVRSQFDTEPGTRPGMQAGMQAGTSVIGITGSAGKTTTTRLLASILRHSAPTCASIKSYNNRLGVSLTILNADARARFLVCEIGTSGPGEIADLALLARPTAAIITSIGRAHLEKLGSVAGVAREKSALLRALGDDSVAVIPAGLALLEDELARDGTGDRLEVIRVGLAGSGIDGIGACGGPGALRSIEADAGGIAFEFARGGRFASPIAGRHNALNAALAAALARALGVPDDAIARGLATPELPPLRAQIERIGGVTLINDCYNANPESMLASLALLGERAREAGAPSAAVLGDMLELGPVADSSHDEVVQAALARGVATLVLIGPLMAAAGARVRTRGPDRVQAPGAGDSDIEAHQAEIVTLPDASDDAVRAAADRLVPGCVALVKGSRGMRLERVRERLARRDETRQDETGRDEAGQDGAGRVEIVTARRARAPMVDP